MQFSSIHLYLFICGLILIKILWSRRKYYLLSLQLPGPVPALPLIGNGYLFIGNPHDALLKVIEIIKKYTTPIRFWLGPNLLVIFDQPKHIEKILTSSKTLHKHDVYDFMKPYAGEGMISGSGPQWKIARKLTHSLYNAKFVSDSCNLFHKHTIICINQLEHYVDKDTFSIEKVLKKCVADMIAEVILGYKLDTQNGRNPEFLQYSSEMYDVVYPRIIKPWLHPDVLYQFSQLKKVQDKHTDYFRKFYEKIIELGKQTLYNNNRLEETDFVPSIVELTRRFLDDSNSLDEDDFRDNLFTLYMASEDTITTIASSLCVLFGMYPETQKKASEELRSILGNDLSNNITYEEIMKMTYLDMCVKETLRLFPIAPFIMRKTSEEFKIDKWTLPSECAIVISIFNVHLNSLLWEKPMDFYPEHFLPETIAKRHPYAYIPFSAGLRGCIGKIFAQVSIKMLMANILRKYVIEANGKYIDIFKLLKADISVRPKCGYNIRIRKRI